MPAAEGGDGSGASLSSYSSSDDDTGSSSDGGAGWPELSGDASFGLEAGVPLAWAPGPCCKSLGGDALAERARYANTKRGRAQIEPKIREAVIKKKQKKAAAQAGMAAIPAQGWAQPLAGRR